MQQGPAPVVSLADLTLQPMKIAIRVKVMRKWIYNGNEPGAAVRYIGLVLADEKVCSRSHKIVHLNTTFTSYSGFPAF